MRFNSEKAVKAILAVYLFMKKNIRKYAAAFFMAVLCMSMLTGCLEDEEEDFADEAVEEEYGEDEEYAEEGSDEAEAYADTEEADEAGSDEQDASGQVTKSAAEGNVSAFCFAGKDVDGNPVEMAQVFAENRITVVNLWASWCGPCAREIPELEKMNAGLKEKGCAVVGILLDGEDPQGLADGKDVLSDAGASYLNVIAPGTLEDEVPIEGYPTTFFVDADGRTVGDPITGAAPEMYLETVEKLLSEQ